MIAEKSFVTARASCFGAQMAKKTNMWHVKSFKKDHECLRWIGGHILKVLTLSFYHMSTFP